LGLDAVIPVPLPLLGTLSKSFKGNAVKVPPMILVEPLQCQQNISLSNPDPSLGTKENRKQQGQTSVGVGHNYHFVL
jgi:hypothetical protein